MMVSHNDVPHTTVILGVISYMLTSLLLNRLPDLTSNRSEHNIYLDLYYTTRDCVLQGVVSFFFYLLLGFLFQETALDISPATVGIGLIFHDQLDYSLNRRRIKVLGLAVIVSALKFVRRSCSTVAYKAHLLPYVATYPLFRA